MENIKNNVSIYAEEQIINEETASIQEILNRNEFKQPISNKYIKLKLEEGNYMGPTNSKWKDKPNYERYGFYLEKEEEKWVQIDIPRNLVEKLEIEKGDDITYPIYLTIDISKKKLIRGAYTIDNEEEVFIDKPVSEKNVEKELIKRLEELEKLREQVKELESLKHEKVELEEKSRILEKKVQEEQGKNDRLDEQMWEGIRVKEELEKELEELKKRSWIGFYDWLLENIVGHCDGGGYYNLKKELEDEYPLLSEKNVSGSSDVLSFRIFFAFLKSHIRDEINFPNKSWGFVFRQYRDEETSIENLLLGFRQTSQSRYCEDALSNIKDCLTKLAPHRTEPISKKKIEEWLKELNKLLEIYRKTK